MANTAPNGIFAKRAGAWVPAADADARVAGSWVQAKTVSAKRAGAWATVWQDNVAPQNPYGLTITMGAWDGAGYTANAYWTLPADADLVAAEVTWAINGVAQAPQYQVPSTLTASLALAPNSTVAVWVRLQDSGALWGPSASAGWLTAPPGAMTGLSATPVSLDVVRLNYTAPAGTSSVYLLRSINGAAATGVWLSPTGPWEDTIGQNVGVTYTLAAVTAAGQWGPTSAVVASDTKVGSLLSFTTAGNYSTDYTTVNLAWTISDGPTGHSFLGVGAFFRVYKGAAASAPTTSGGDTLPVIEDTKYVVTLKVESNYRGRLAVGPTRTLRLAIGHAAYSTTRPWSGAAAIHLHDGQAGGVAIPADVLTYAMAVNVAATNTSVLTSSTRKLNYIWGNVVGAAISGKPNPWKETVDLVRQGPLAANNGLKASGGGWTWAESGADTYIVTGAITIYGNETYTSPAVASGYY